MTNYPPDPPPDKHADTYPTDHPTDRIHTPRPTTYYMPPPTASDALDALDITRAVLTSAHQLVTGMGELRRLLGVIARDHGATLVEVGEAMEVSRQRAHQLTTRYEEEYNQRNQQNQHADTDYPTDPRGVLETDGTGPNDMTCGVCGRSWDDSHISDATPTPSARCPFEYNHPTDHQAEE